MAASIAIHNTRRAFGRAGWLAGLSAAGVLALGALGCAGDTTAPAALSPAQGYWALELNQHAILLALQSTYDTVQLTATPKTVLGTPFTTTGTVTYKALDSTVSVSATGLVTAHSVTAAGHPARVAAQLQDLVQNITHTDTAFIVVTTAPAPPLVSYSLQPVPGDSAKRSLDFRDFKAKHNPQGLGGFDWSVRAVDATGATVCDTTHCGLLVYYHASTPRVAVIDPHTGHVTQLDTGHVVFTAQTLAYGQVLRDSVAFQIGYQLQASVWITLLAVLGVLTVGFVAPKKLLLGVGAVVLFCNGSNDGIQAVVNNKPVDIVFDHPETVDTASCTYPTAPGHALPPTGRGNIPAFGGDTTSILRDVACRRFPVAGVYHYHSTLFPSDTYEIDIQADPQ